MVHESTSKMNGDVSTVRMAEQVAGTAAMVAPQEGGDPKADENGNWDAFFSSCGFNEEDLRETLQAEREVMGSSHHSHEENTVQSRQSEIGSACSKNSLNPPSSPSTTQAPAAALNGLQEALESLSGDRKQAYQEALAKNPRVVELETPPHRFLQNSQYNFWAAAEMMVDHWTIRKEIFGEERFWKPLTLWHVEQGESAMATETFEAIEKSKIAIAPNPDAFGRLVCVADHNQWNPHASGERANAHLQAVFYIFQVLSESDLAISNGGVFVVAPARTESDKQEKSNNVGDFVQRLSKKRGSKSVIRLILQSGIFPTSVRAAHLLVPSSSSAITRFYANVWLKIANEWNFLSFRARAHRVEEAAEGANRDDENQEPIALRTLSEYGLGKNHIPERFGGLADGASFFQHRLKVERERYAPRGSVNGTPAILENSRDKKQNEAESQAVDAGNILEQQRMEEFQQWAKGHVEQLEVMRLESQIRNQRQQQRDLKQIGDFLQSRLECAKYVERQYSWDLRFIRQRLEEFVAPLFEQGDKQDNCITPIPSTTPTQSGMVDQILQQHLVFRGRLPSCGLWTFGLCSESPTPLGSPSATVEQHALWSSVQQFLLLEQQVLLDEERELFQIRPLKDENLSLADEQDDVELNHLLKDLENKRVQLQQQNHALQQQKKYLASSFSCSEFLSQSYDKYKSDHREVIANGFYQVLSAVPWAMRDGKGQVLPLMSSGEEDRSALKEYARSLVDRCFDLFTIFDEQQLCFCNPVVLVSQSLANFESKRSQTPLISSVDEAAHATKLAPVASDTDKVHGNDFGDTSKQQQRDQDCNFLRDMLISILSNPHENSIKKNKNTKEAYAILTAQGSLPKNNPPPNNPNANPSGKKRSRDAMNRRQKIKRKKMLQRL